MAQAGVLVLISLLFASVFAADQQDKSARQSGLPIQSTVYYGSANSCSNVPVVMEVLFDMSTFPGGQCFGSGSCSLTAQTQADNSVTRVTSCLSSPIHSSSLPLRVNLFTDSSCTRMRSSQGYTDGCIAGTLNGLSAGGSMRNLCDSSGNVYQVVYNDGGCGSPKSCVLLESGPANTCIISVEDPSSYQITSCSTVSSVPSICPPSGRVAPTTTAAPTARPAPNLDINRDGKIDILDVAVLLDAWGLCPFSGPCPADLAVPYGRVDSYDLLALMNGMPRK